VRWLPDSTVEHLRDVAEWPDLSATRYEILGRIGRGGMATVYVARDRELGREVAVKVPHGTHPTPAEGARLLQEARILARLEHPGIVPVHDLGTLPDGRVFYVMKRVQGTRLDEHARATPSLGERLRVFMRIAEPVAFAHAHGVIHRDLKPENIMVGPFGEVLVMDWGVARIRGAPAIPGGEATTLPAELTDTAPGTVLGTPGYMAPEQAVGDLDLIDARSDVYALGGILYYLLTGRPPRGTADGAVSTGGSSARQPPRRWVPSLPRPLEAICLKALADAPGDRYASVEQLAADVARFLERLPTEAYPEGAFERVLRFAAKYQVAIVLVAAYLIMRVVLLLLGGS
jgi:serine/threonine protein kinase